MNCSEFVDRFLLGAMLLQYVYLIINGLGAIDELYAFFRFPAVVKSALDSILETSTSMKEFFNNSDPTLEGLADELDDLSTAISLPDETNSFASQLSTAQTNIEAIKAASVDFITDLDALIISLNTVNGLKGSVDSQLSSYPSTGTPGAYSTLTTATDAIKSSVLAATTELALIDSDYVDEFSAASNLESSLSSLRVQVQVSLLFHQAIAWKNTIIKYCKIPNYEL